MISVWSRPCVPSVQPSRGAKRLRWITARAYCQKRCPPNVALCLYRVAQEALRNVAKHAAAAEVVVTLNVVGPEVVLRIEDFGIGFDRENERSQPGLGLSSMAERVALIEGQFSVTSAVGRGTTVDVRAPLKGCPR